MKKLLVLGLVALFATSANGAYFWLADLNPANPIDPNNPDGYGLVGQYALAPSDLASVGVYLSISAADIAAKTDAAIAGAWLDTDGPGNYEVTDLIYHGMDINGAGNDAWNRVDRDAIPGWVDGQGLTAPISPEEYTGSYGYDPQQPNGAPFATADTPALIDELVLHGTAAPGIDNLYFENPMFTPVNTRVPVLFNSLNSGYVYAFQNDFSGSIVMINAWADPAASNFNVPFVVETVVPEPASLALLAIGGLALIRRR